MKPQPRHIEAARTIVRPMLASYHVSPKLNQPSFDPYEAIAIAIAEAENRAAWDVKQNQPDESTYEWLEAKYGPRPTTENQP